MSVVKINAITVPGERGEELAQRFARRAGAVGSAPGFEEFQLLRPTDERTTWLVYTRWRDEESFQAWLSSNAFQAGHRQAEGPGGPVAMGAELWSYAVVQEEAVQEEAVQEEAAAPTPGATEPTS